LKFETFNNTIYDISKVKAIWGGFFLFTVQFMLFGAMAGIMYLSGILYQRGKINIGIITSFLFYMVMLLFNFARAASVFGEVMAILGASDKVVELIQYKAAINTQGGDKISDNEVSGVIEIKDVKFNYPSKKDV